MAHRKIKFEREKYYHRGVLKTNIFLETDNYLFLLEKVQKYSAELGINIIAYCLMPNHYHFLVQQKGEQPVRKFVQRLFNSFTKAFNKKYDRSGTLFEGPYKAVCVEDTSYLIHLCRYIHRNPLDAKLVNRIGEWPFSNLKEWLGMRNGSLFDQEFQNTYFDSSEEYLDFLKTVESKENLDKYLFE
ncbi:transposase [Aliifodinibius sp. S!AR15-10]|uniref:transposase n=1 Tax=Aliifodinibius sp. S!AR15-10 TaxID=2950437 RepID=UPI00285F5FBE|nr:transposase [Aliifodinibius sp. S!AR15-10]MDR8392162.1 transposase [Aliifodinibius sp. S!AR15-10]